MTGDFKPADMFDERVFLALTGFELDRYVERIERCGRRGIDKRTISSLLERIDRMPFLTAFYVFCWAIDLRLDGVSNVGIELLYRAGLEGGGEISVLKMLCKAHDFSAEHLRQIESMILRDTWGGVAEQITLLKDRLSRTSKRKG